MSASSPAAPLQLGFLTIVRDGAGFTGGYLVTNLWGRPLEFRLTTPVQPNRVQQILYGDSLFEYLYGEIIGKSLIEKTTTAAQAVFTDTAEALALRRAIDLPVGFVMPTGNEEPECPADEAIIRPADAQRGAIVIDLNFRDDSEKLRDVLERIGGLDLTEPFARIREAVTEARKMGVMQRAG